MASEPVIYDISSDEEEFWDESCTPSDWLTKLFTDEHEQIDKSDDVVVVDEILTSQKRNCVPLKLKKWIARDVDNDDDDCLILDGDPDEQAPTVNGEENGSDDLLIVGEKGQLACRDYPHPRHLCAKFPFSSHSHEKHCNLCHCYVCDIPAPCIYWGTGVSYSDHCHAIDKDENWKVERKSFKQGIMVTSSVQKLLETTPSMSSFRVSSMSSHSSTVSRSFPHRTYHKTCTRTPNTLSHRHNNQQLRSVNGTRMLPQYPTGSRSPHVDSGRVNIYKGKSRSTVLAPQFAHANRFKRVGPPGGSLVTASRSGYDLSSNNLSVVTDNDLNLKQWRDLLDCLDTEMDTVQNFSQPGHASNFTNFQPFIASQPQAYAPSSPQLLVNENIYPFENPTIDGIEPGSLAFDHVQSNATPQITSHHPAEDPTFPSGQTATLQAETPANIQPPQSNMLNFGIENWTFPLVDVPMPVGSTRDALLPEMEYVPAQPATPDTGILYEFDNLWGGLARV